MNRRIKQKIQIIRNELDDIERLLPEEEPTEVEEMTIGEGEFKKKVEEIPEELVNWTVPDETVATRPARYLKDLRELTELKGITIYGQIKTVFDLKSYIHPKTQEAGIIYRIVLTDDTSDVTVIAFDDMATKLKQYTVGQYLKITNAWKMQENKHGKMELHIGNFAKIEVIE